MTTEGRVHGMSVWQSIKQALPFTPKVFPGQSAMPTSNNTQKRLDVEAKSFPSSATATLETPFASPSNRSLVETESTSKTTSSNSIIPHNDDSSLDFGYAKSLERRYRIDKEIARGGNGIVFLVTDLHTGKEFAMKSIPKVPTDPKISEKKRMEHTASIRREVDVLRRLRGCLNVASLEEVYEDDTHIHMVMEYCRGGELYHRIGAAHYSERTVASFMRATLRTLAQCHANKILHRDIKPGNFLLSSEDERAPLKAVDFGLAVFYDDKELPLTDLSIEGTPWFMAPEALRSEVYPSSDVWSAGVMAHQLLTGRFPFDDKSSPHNPSLSKVWKSILTDELKFKDHHWEGISDEAKDFVKLLLNKDHTKRPTAKEALKHPWLQGHVSERSSGRPLSFAIVQRIQRYSQASLFKRTILELMAEELLSEREQQQQQLAATDTTTTNDTTNVNTTNDTTNNNPPASCALSEDARPLIDSPTSSPMEYLYERLRMVDRSLIDRSALAQGLEEMGYKLAPEEVERLLDQLDPGNTGYVAKSQLAASQIDWAEMQSNNTESWLRLARRAFADLDADRDGLVSAEDMVALLRHKLPPSDVDRAVKQALLEAARRKDAVKSNDNPTVHSVDDDSSQSSVGGSLRAGDNITSHHSSSTSINKLMKGSPSDPSLRNGLNFRQFLRMLNAGSADSLDIYDDRLGSLGSPADRTRSGSGSLSAAVALGSPLSSYDRVNLLLERSVKGSDAYSMAVHGLDPVPE